MRRFFLILIGVCLLLGVTWWAAAAVLPLSMRPARLRTWLPVPIACAGRHCVTYRTWAAAVPRDSSPQPVPDAANQSSSARAADLLTELLTSRAVGIVARRAGLTVSKGEVDAALKTVATVAADAPGLQQFLVEQYGDLTNPGFRSGMRDLLTRTKLAAAGISDVWAAPGAPWVLMLHVRYRWDPTTHRVVAR